MTNQEILVKAIQKAIDGGWTMGHYYRAMYDAYGQLDASSLAKRTAGEFIFNHDFAKALWGEHIPAEPTPPVNVSNLKKGQSMTITAPPPKNIGWERHLQQMVIADDPIKYLGENI